MDTETLLIVALAVGGALWWQSQQENGARYTRDGTRYQPSNPHSGVSDGFGVGYDLDPILFGQPRDDTQAGGGDGEFGVTYPVSF